MINSVLLGITIVSMMLCRSRPPISGQYHSYLSSSPASRLPTPVTPFLPQAAVALALLFQSYRPSGSPIAPPCGIVTPCPSLGCYGPRNALLLLAPPSWSQPYNLGSMSILCHRRQRRGLPLPSPLCVNIAGYDDRYSFPAIARQYSC